MPLSDILLVHQSRGIVHAFFRLPHPHHDQGYTYRLQVKCAATNCYEMRTRYSDVKLLLTYLILGGTIRALYPFGPIPRNGKLGNITHGTRWL